MAMLLFIILSFSTPSYNQCYLTSSLKNFKLPSSGNSKLDTSCIGDTVTLKWLYIGEPIQHNVKFYWGRLAPYIKIISPVDQEQLTFIVDKDIDNSINWNLWSVYIYWENNDSPPTIDTCGANYPIISRRCGSRSLFSTDKSGLCVGDCVEWKSESKYIPTSWEWRFEGGSPSSFIGEIGRAHV